MIQLCRCSAIVDVQEGMPQAGSLPEALFNDEVENSMNNKIAIDFGTSRTKAAYHNTNKENAELVELGRGGRKAIPSLFHYDKKGEISIGEEAQDWMQSEPLAIIARLKLQLQQNLSSRISGKRILPEVLLAHLFTKIRELVEEDLSIFSGQSSRLSVVLTTTLHFQFHEREVLKSAAEKAGFEPPVEFLPEPEAAVRAWVASSAKESIDKSTEVVVLDCGGGTLDWAYLHEDRDGKFHLNALLPPGAAKIGGEAVDEALLVRHVIPKLPREDAVDAVLLREEVRGRKEAYCKKQPDRPVRVGPDQFVPLKGCDIQAVIDEKFITPACDAIESYLRNVASVTGREMPPVLLVGGSAFLKGLKERLAERFGCKVFSWDRGEFATVLGAAVPLLPEQEPDATYERAVAYVNADKFAEAIVEFQAVLKHAPKHADAHAGIAEVHLELGNLEEAAKAAGRAIELEPNHELALQTRKGIIQVHRAWGAGYMGNRNYTDALSEFKKALDIDPLHAEARVDSAQAYLKLGEIEEAEKAVQKVLKHDPRSPRAQRALVDIAACYLALDKIEKAESACHKVLDHNPNFRPARQVLDRIALAKTEAAEKDEEGGPRVRALPRQSAGRKTEAVEKDEEGSFFDWDFAVVTCLGIALGLVYFIWFIHACATDKNLSWSPWEFMIAFVVFIWDVLFLHGMWTTGRTPEGEEPGCSALFYEMPIRFFYWVWCRISGKREE